ncbi:MAG: glycerol-3-phosphate 1-O-acyltransferase PlsY [Bacilli bacterium]|nr:glycerol-3-phosphate 1-O-acyltransferase PlsY [Bacilli bacterium]
MLLLNIIVAIGCVVYGFLLGSIPTGVVVGKVFFGKDPREFGSHNSGGTNTGRVLGKKVGILVMVLDIAKNVVAFWSVWAILRFAIGPAKLFDGGVLYAYFAQAAACFGHCFSPWLHFKGGKAVACFMAIFGGSSWAGFAISLVVFFVSFFGLKKVMSKASILSGAILVLIAGVFATITMATGNYKLFDPLMWNFGAGGGVYFGWEMMIAMVSAYVLLVIRHSANIQRIRKGEEKPLEWK